MATGHTQKTYTAAVIGLGFIGAGDQVSGDALGQQVVNLDGTHAHALAGNPRVQLVAGSSRDEGRRTRFTERLGVDNTYADWRRMLAEEELDIVGVATYSPWHAEITIACAKAGVKAVLCDKPIATRLADANRMIDVCREHGTLLAINHNRRWHPMWRDARDAIAAGAIGTVSHVMLNWSSGRLGNVGTHMFDACAMLLGRSADEVSGRIDTVLRPDCRGSQFKDPGGWGVMRFGDVKVFVDASTESQAPLGFRLFGSEGCIRMSKFEAVIEREDGERRCLTPPDDGLNSMDRAVAEIVASLDGESALCSKGEHGRDALEAIIGFHVSDRNEGAATPLPLTGADRDMEVRIG